MVARVVLALVVLLARAAAADVTVRASIDPPEIQVGESAALAIEVDGAQNAPVPDVPAVDGLTLRYLGPSTQVSIVNGQVSQSVTHRFSVATARPGTFTIGPSSVTIGGSPHEVAAATPDLVGAFPPRPAAGAAPGGGQLP